MSISNYTELKTAVSNWMTRGDIATQAAECIQLAEAGLNRELSPVELDTTLTGTLDSRTIDISSLSMVAPVALFLAQTGLDEVQMTPKEDGTFVYRTISSYPRYWAIDGTNIDFDCPLSQAYPFRFRYRQRFALSDAAPTNWLLTNHPDLYLAACVVWGSVFIQDAENALPRWTALLNSALPSVRNIIAQSKRAVLTVDPSLVRRPRYPYAWWYYQ